MLRRTFLQLAGLATLSIPQVLKAKEASYTYAEQAWEGNLIEAGWVLNKRLVSEFIRSSKNPYLSQINADIRGTGAGQIALLWPFLEQAMGRQFIPHEQEIGDCVSHGYGLGVDILTATQIIKRNSPQKWVAEAATEIIYGGGRIEIAAQEYGMRWSTDGMTGTVAAEFVKRYGILLRQKYLNWDFSTYNGGMARELGRRGVPDPLESFCKVHPVGCVTLCTSWDEARDCIFNGYPVTLCSSQGFNTRYGRDKDGFLSPGRKPWMHCMLLAGIDDAHSRPGGLIINSWGDFVQGPKRHGQPDGSFWADASVIDRMCKQGDSIALSCYAGYPRMDYLLW